MTVETFSEDLKQGLCRSFDVRAEGEGRWVVRTPMLYDDGDALPVIVLDLEIEILEQALRDD